MFPTPAAPMTCPAALYHLLVWLKPSYLQAPERAQRSLLAHCSIATRVASESLPPPSPELEGVSQQTKPFPGTHWAAAVRKTPRISRAC